MTVHPVGNPPGYNVGTSSTFECQENFPRDFECRNDGQWHAKFPKRYPERKCSKYGNCLLLALFSCNLISCK